jgi:hypothetical protein
MARMTSSRAKPISTILLIVVCRASPLKNEVPGAAGAGAGTSAGGCVGVEATGAGETATSVSGAAEEAGVAEVDTTGLGGGGALIGDGVSVLAEAAAVGLG